MKKLLLILCLLLFPTLLYAGGMMLGIVGGGTPAAGEAPANNVVYVQSVAGIINTTYEMFLTVPGVVGGNTVIVGVRSGGETVGVVSDTTGRVTFTAVEAEQNGMKVYYGYNSGTTGDVILGITLTNISDAIAFEFHGIVTTTPMDGFESGQAESTTVSSGNITTTNANDVLIGFTYVNTDVTSSIAHSTNFTESEKWYEPDYTGATCYGEYYIVTSTQTNIHTNVSWTGTHWSYAYIVALKSS
jgi:hypothetical protein